MPDGCDRQCCCSSHAATARITRTGNACLVSSYVAGNRLEQTLAGHPRAAPSPFAALRSRAAGLPGPDEAGASVAGDEPRGRGLTKSARGGGM